MQTSLILFSCGLIVLFLSYQSGQAQYRYVKEQNQNQSVFIPGFLELQNYCLAHPDNTYLIEAQSLGYYHGSALSSALYQPRNSLVSGCWYWPSPHMKETVMQYIGETKVVHSQPGKTPLYFIVTSGQEDRVAPILTYLSEYTGHPWMLSDQFTVSHGGTYLVYCFE